MYFSGIEETIVMTHHQMALNLLKGIDDDTDQNEKRRTSKEL